jgi:hypothetical protein
VSGQDDRERERHARDGVWLPAGEERPGARGFADSRHKPGPGIAKGEAFSPLVRPRQRQVGKSPRWTGRKRIKQNPDPKIPDSRPRPEPRVVRWGTDVTVPEPAGWLSRAPAQHLGGGGEAA